jgi:Endonuclease-reverse transcriptase
MNHAYKPHHVIKVLQINLRHSRLATAALSQTLLDQDTDIALVQEPYATRLNADSPPTIPNLPVSFEALHRLDSEHHYGAAILVKKSLKCRLIPDLSKNHVAAVRLDLDGRAFLFLSVYLRPSLPSLETELLPILSFSSSLLTRAIIGADTNAKSPLWNSNCSNARGRELESLLARFPLNVCNLPADSLPFAPADTSFIDVTLVGNAVEVNNWHFPDIPSLSDHPFISFELACSMRRSARSARVFNFLPPLQNLDKDKFQEMLRANLKKRKPPPIVTDRSATPSCIDDAVSFIVELITLSARSSRLLFSSLSTAGRMPWWSNELSHLRRETRKTRKKWVSCTTSEKELLHISFKHAKALYQRALRLAIEQAWLDFCAQASDSDLLDSLKRLAGNKSVTPFPSLITVDDKTITDPAEILERFASHFFGQPIDPDVQDNAPFCQPAPPPPVTSAAPFSPRVSVVPISPVAHIEYPPISSVELADAIAALSPDASPGPDGISSGLLSLSAQIINPFFFCLF